MCDLYATINVDSQLEEEFEGLLEAFDTHHVTTDKLLLCSASEVSRLCGRSVNEVSKFLIQVRELIKDVNGQHSVECALVLFEASQRKNIFTTFDNSIDHLLAGGVRTGAITEFVGEAGAGKSNLLMQLTLSVQLPRSLGGLGRGAIVLSTESGSFDARRIHTILTESPSDLKKHASPDRILVYNCDSQDELEHMVNFQVPLAIERSNVGLVIIDSIAALYRTEFLGQSVTTVSRAIEKFGYKLGRLAEEKNVAVVVANQVSDQFKSDTKPDQEVDPLSRDYQLQWFSGWKNHTPQRSGYSQQTHRFEIHDYPKVPSLGMIWACIIDIRVVLKRRKGGFRTMELVFSPWAPPQILEFEIVNSGVHSLALGNDDEELDRPHEYAD